MESGSLQTGTGGVFETRPKNFAVTDLGYMATQHKEILHTEFGHIWVDAQRGQVFLLQSSGGAVEEISRNGMRNWFKENLPFQISRDFPELTQYDLDNSYKGIGITMTFDKRFNRLFITKLDYKKINNNVHYNKDNKTFYFVDPNQRGNVVIDVTDTKYFCNKSWTISYSFLTNTWTSYHSFTPNYYINYVDHFCSGLNSTNSTLWGHNLTNKSYGVYYGKLYPYILEIQSENEALNSLLNSINYTQEAILYHNNYDQSINREITFNKAIVYNNLQNSGLLELKVLDQNNNLGSLHFLTLNKIHLYHLFGYILFV